MRDIDLATVLTAYIECALWATPDDSDDSGGVPLDENYCADDFTDDTRNGMKGDVADFVASVQAQRPDAFDGMWDSQIGHDFWLTRNRHGAGFWDRGLGELGDYLTGMAHPYGEADLFVGQDGKIHSS